MIWRRKQAQVENDNAQLQNCKIVNDDEDVDQVKVKARNQEDAFHGMDGGVK